MDGRAHSIDRYVHSDSILARTSKIPSEFISVSANLLQILEFVFLALMPEHRFAKDQSQRHFVDQCFQRARLARTRTRARTMRVRTTAVRRGKICMGPSPEVAMPKSRVVPLYSEPQRIPIKTAAIERDLAGKNRVGMWRSGKSDPSLVAQGDAKRGTPVQIPRDRVALNFQVPPAGIFGDFVVADSQVKRILPPRAEIKTFQGKSLNEALRFSIPRKPSDPNLDRHPARATCAAAPPRIHKQISEPPRPAAVGQSQTKKPDFITAPGRE